MFTALRSASNAGFPEDQLGEVVVIQTKSLPPIVSSACVTLRLVGPLVAPIGLRAIEGAAWAGAPGLGTQLPKVVQVSTTWAWADWCATSTMASPAVTNISGLRRRLRAIARTNAPSPNKAMLPGSGTPAKSAAREPLPRFAES